MQNIRNFRLAVPTEEQLNTYAIPGGDVPLFLTSEDSQDWYECQALFADDTIKIVYDSAGVIRSIVDAPVPQRGNILAVSMFFPVDMSVAELGSVPDGCTSDGTWMFNGSEVLPVPVDFVALARIEQSRRLKSASEVIASLQDAVDLGEATEEEAGALPQWKAYRLALNRLDISLAPDIDWPATLQA